MARKNLKRYALRYTAIGGLPSGVAIFGIAALLSIPLRIVAFILPLISFTLAALLVGVTEAGIETASAGAEAGHMSGSDAMQYQPAELPIPDRLAIVCWLCGVGIIGVTGFVWIN